MHFMLNFSPFGFRHCIFGVPSSRHDGTSCEILQGTLNMREAF